MLRLQAANRPHTDLAPHEVESAVRMSEHLMYLAQRGRGTLGTLAASYSQLTRLLRLLGALGTAEGGAEALTPQVGRAGGHKAGHRQEPWLPVLSCLPSQLTFCAKLTLFGLSSAYTE